MGVLHLLTNDVDGVIGLVTDGVISTRGQWDDVIYGNLEQVQIRVDSSNLL